MTYDLDLLIYSSLTQEATLPALDRGATSAAIERTADREGFKFSLRVWFVLRITLSVLGALIMLSAPDWTHDHVRTDYPDVTLPNHDLYGYTVGLWNLYDVRHYTDIAENGYTGDLSWLTAYFPGYPLLIKAVSFPALGDYLLAALIVSESMRPVVFLVPVPSGEYGLWSRGCAQGCRAGGHIPQFLLPVHGLHRSIVLAGRSGAIYYARKDNGGRRGRWRAWRP